MVWLMAANSLISQPTPMKTETVTFPPIPVGALRENGARVDELPPNAKYEIENAPSSPFRCTSSDAELTVKNGSIDVRIEFAPTVSGDFQDELLLRRNPQTGQPLVDIVRVRLFGTAFRIERTDEVNFDDLMTGDTAKRVVVYKVNRNDDFEFNFIGQITEPFTLITKAGPARRGPDTLFVGLAFHPLTAGSYADTIGLQRKDRMGRVLDTAYIMLSGTGRVMPAEVVVDLTDLVAGDYAGRQVNIDLPAKVNSTYFTYDAVSRGAAPYTSATVSSPLLPSKQQRVTVDYVVNPKRMVDEQSVYLLQRKGAGGSVIDSTRIVLDVKARPRPVTLAATFGTDTVRARIGDTISLRVVASAAEPIDDDIVVTKIRYSIAYNPTVLVPILGPGQTRSVENDRQIVTTVLDQSANPIVIRADQDVFTTLNAVVALGDAETSSIDIVSFEYETAGAEPISITSKGTTLAITNVWRYSDGNARFVNPLQGVLVMELDPNPVSATATLSIRNCPSNSGRLDVADELGNIRVNLTQALRAGQRDFSIATSGTADVVLPRGTYYVRCVIESALGGSIHSVVRVFVIQ